MMEVRELEVEQLKPWENNPRLNEQAVEAVARSVKSFGFNVPILCDQNLTIIAGHTRWKAAQALGLKTVPVIVLQMSESQRRAFSIADNKTAESADWDFPKLQNVLEELRHEDIDLSLLGYSDQELEALLTPEEDLDWSSFDQRQAEEQIRTHIFLPVKIRADARRQLEESIANYAKEQNIGGKDIAVLAGNVLTHLLGL